MKKPCVSIFRILLLTAHLFLIVLTGSHIAQAQPGAVDPAFNGGAVLTNGAVNVFKRQIDGKILVGGSFEGFNGRAQNSVARLNADGTVDATFNPPNIVGTIRAIEIQPDGKILIGGSFVIPLLTNNTFVARLNADGSFDNSFVAPTLFTADPNNAAYDLAIAADGKIYVAGSFFYQIPNTPSATRSKFARFNSDGTLDTTFAPVGTFTDIYDIEIQPDGKVVGVMTDGGSNARFIKRFNADGTEDFSFNALVTGASGTVRVNALKIQTDGKILIAGAFNLVNNTARVGAARLNANGTLDTAFNVTSNGTLNEVEIE
ncbi:MAG TPA: hypothetical protein VK308_03280, partial [Pyrinomonadaceae bacterium]|nr:hypothetical protein [Pyrinomonadaceae bacterium]